MERKCLNRHVLYSVLPLSVSDIDALQGSVGFPAKSHKLEKQSAAATSHP